MKLNIANRTGWIEIRNSDNGNLISELSLINKRVNKPFDQIEIETEKPVFQLPNVVDIDGNAVWVDLKNRVNGSEKIVKLNMSHDQFLNYLTQTSSGKERSHTISKEEIERVLTHGVALRKERIQSAKKGNNNEFTDAVKIDNNSSFEVGEIILLSGKPWIICELPEKSNPKVFKSEGKKIYILTDSEMKKMVRPGMKKNIQITESIVKEDKPVVKKEKHEPVNISKLILGDVLSIDGKEYVYCGKNEKGIPKVWREGWGRTYDCSKKELAAMFHTGKSQMIDFDKYTKK